MNVRLNSVYRQAHENTNRYRVLYGGAGSGKSHFVGQEIILNMLSSGEYKYLVTRKTGRSIRNSVFALLTELISDMNLSHAFIINKTEMAITCVTGSMLITSGLDDVEKLKSIANINRIWIEEASEVSETDFNQLDLRMRGQSKIGYQMTITFNPVSELHWLKKSFFDLGRPDSFVLKTTYLDNEFLDEKYINTLSELKNQDYQYYRIYALGEWGSLGGLIFSNWEKQDLSDVKGSFDNIYHGLDWGFAEDPTAYIQVHYEKSRKEIYILDELYLKETHVDDLADKLRNKVDSFITCDSSEPRSISDLKRHGIRSIAAKKGPGSIEHGIKWLQSHKIIVDSGCVNTIKELSSYKWKQDKDGNILPKPVDLNNHLCDALRYCLESEMKRNRVKAIDKSILGL